MTGRSRVWTTTNGYGRTGRRRRCSNERHQAGPAGDNPAVCQATAIADGGRSVCAPGRRSSKGEAIAPELSGGAAGSGGGRTRSQGDSAKDSGSALPGGEDAGGVRFPGRAAHSSGSDEESERGRISGAQGAGHFSGRDGDGEDALGNRVGGGRLPAAQAGEVYDGGGNGDRADRSQEPVGANARAESLDALRPYRDRRTGLRGHAGRRGGVAVSGHRGTRRASGGDCDNELAVFRMDHEVSQCAVMQGDAGPLDSSST